MNSILRLKRSAFIVIDETGYDKDDNSDGEESSYEFLYRSNKMRTKSKTNNTTTDQVLVNDANDVIDIDEPSSSQENSTNKDKAKNGRIADLEVRKKKSNSKMNDEVIIDDDDEDIIVEHAVKASGRKRKRTYDTTVDTRMVETAGPPTFKQRSKSKKLTKHVDEESDEDVKLQSSMKTERKHKIVVDPDKSDRKVRVREQDNGLSTSTGIRETRKKRIDRKTDVGAQKTPEMDVVLLIKNEIDDDNEDKDIEVERKVDRVKKKKTRLNDVVLPKRIKRDKASTSKQILEVDKTGELSDDGSEESIDIVEYRPKRKTVKKSKNNCPVIDMDTLDRRGRRDNGHEMNESKDSKKTIKRIKLMDKEEESDTDIALLSENEITVITDDEDTEDIKSETIIKEKRSLPETMETEERTFPEKAKTTRAENKEEGESSFTQEPRKNTQRYNIKENPKVEWSECDYLCEFNKIEPRVAENLLTLFKNDCTIPFIARYRKEMTGGLEPEKLRSIKNSYDNMKLVKAKALLILQNIDKLGKWNPEIYSDVMSAKTLDDLAVIYAPFKPGAKTSFAERAKELGLAPVCDDILQGRPIASLHSFINPGKEGLRNLEEVRQGVIHILAHVITKDKTTAEAIAELRTRTEATIATKPRNISKAGMEDNRSEADVQKYKHYLNSTWFEKTIKDYQILAINRGEDQKVFSVSINMPNWFKNELKKRCLQKYRFVKDISVFRREILEQSFDDAYARLIKSQISRQVRHQLSERAENASIEVFANNLKNLLLTPPIRGKTVLGIDPGFKQGCKLAVVSPCGDVLDTAKIYPHSSSESQKKEAAQILARLVKRHNCTVAALGNATACRQTEQFLSNLIQDRVFAPIDLSYTIVDEAGASIYSCSKEAKSEFPNLDPNLISAVSIARRLQDPLAELVKVDPKHLGIGMYQHDLPQKQLQLTLNEVVSEVVSFVGVDVNTASQCLLKKVAGLTEAKATNIIKHRTSCGPITNRQMLLKVSGIGPKTFEQCAGFVRILPETASVRGALSSMTKHRLDYLDQTWIHPESYDIAGQFLKACRCSPADLGTERFIDTVSSYARRRGRKILADEYGTSETTMDIIINGLSMKKGQDIRIEKSAPLFIKNLRCIDDLEVDARLTGSVRNVTNFGVFVDIGVGNNGLIHVSEMRGRVLTVGQKVEVLVRSIDKARGRISLSLMKNCQ